MESKSMPAAIEMVTPPCLICKVSFSSWSSLKVHLAGVHGEYRPHSCTHCDFTSPLVSEMAAHAEETSHFVKINQVFDSYKASFIARLIDDHVEKAREGGGSLIDSAAEPGTGQTMAKSAEDPIPNGVTHGGAAAKRGGVKKRATPIPSLRSAGVRRVKTVPIRRVVQQGGTILIQPSRIPRLAIGKVVKKKRQTSHEKVKCHYTGCGVDVSVTDKWNHMAAHHVNPPDLHCPVGNCVWGRGNNGHGGRKGKATKTFRTLKSHILLNHRGVKALNDDELARYLLVKEVVSKEVFKIRQQCFPNNKEEDGKGRKAKKGAEG